MTIADYQRLIIYDWGFHQVVSVLLLLENFTQPDQTDQTFALFATAATALLNNGAVLSSIFNLYSYLK